jgi:hypothetical protein
MKSKMLAAPAPATVAATTVTGCERLIGLLRRFYSAILGK